MVEEAESSDEDDMPSECPCVRAVLWVTEGLAVREHKMGSANPCCPALRDGGVMSSPRPPLPFTPSFSNGVLGDIGLGGC